jgi:hypothetical protein
VQPISNEEIKEIIEKEEQERVTQFLKVWKIAVNMIGPRLFTVTAPSVEAATDYRQLRPNMEVIRQYLQDDDKPAHLFLYLVVSFYDFIEIEALFRATGHMIPNITDLQFLSDTERMIVYALVEHTSVDDEW